MMNQSNGTKLHKQEGGLMARRIAINEMDFAGALLMQCRGLLAHQSKPPVVHTLFWALDILVCVVKAVEQQPALTEVGQAETTRCVRAIVRCVRVPMIPLSAKLRRLHQLQPLLPHQPS